jgi:hypothetical protein
MNPEHATLQISSEYHKRLNVGSTIYTGCSTNELSFVK